MSDENGSAPAKPVIRFHLTAESMANIELGEILDIEENPNDIRKAMAFMKRFLVDEQGQPLADEEATAAIRRVTLGQLQAAYARVMTDMQETAVPNG